jgi:hypothetical protein
MGVVEPLEALGCDPIEGMAAFAIVSNTDISLRFKAFKELAQYLYPKCKAVEVSDQGDSPIALLGRLKPTLGLQSERS